MPAPYSMDLRVKVVERYKAGGISKEQLSAEFLVGLSTVKRWLRRDRKGNLKFIKNPGRPPSITHEHKAFLSECIISEPSITLLEMGNKLSEQYGLSISEAYICKLVTKLGFRRKKKLYLPTEQLRVEIKKKG